MLIEFIFTSATPAPLAWTELEVLRHECERRNKIEGITGMLLYDGKNFMQVIEGQEQKVLALFRLIASDSRHCNVEAIISNPIENRNFKSWSMGVITLDENNQTQQVTELTGKSKKPLSFKLLNAFAHQEIRIDALSHT
ncbi:BLUF domain-containing protein [Pseudoalteromonas phenolica]|uniref:BLUF domain-containing protein n=1 Tax=Pseudoalteromonas phenolica TaxID=161398 RepID=UPI00110AD917|nr:BLUF domain-containing protein [Pseudoalteromonas phenolica]TMO57965.1 hypothetical protein CWC21_01555 [Pseudoalteromonas phenolica]